MAGQNDTQSQSQRTVVLVVDDEDSLRKLICMVLRAEGYQVLQARNGQEALQVFVASDVPIHILVSDILMPGMDGITLSAQLHDKNPDLQVVLMSGYLGDNLDGGKRVEDETFEVLCKPFLPHELVTTLRRIGARNSHVADLVPNNAKQAM